MEAMSCTRCGLGLWPDTTVCPRCAQPQSPAADAPVREAPVLLAFASPPTRPYRSFTAVTPVTRQHLRNRGVLLVVIGFTFVLTGAIASWVSYMSALHTTAAPASTIWIGAFVAGGAFIAWGVRRLSQL
jgi:hypothetical protein